MAAVDPLHPTGPLARTCPKCGATPGNWCVGVFGMRERPHWAR
jgi:hypothetical protein